MARGTPDWGLVTGGLQAVAEFDTYISAEMVTAAPGAVRHLLSLFNPAGSGVLVTVHRVLLLASFPVINSDVDVQLRLHRTTSLGTGTALTPQPTDPNSPAAAVSARTALTVAPAGLVQLTRQRFRFRDNIAAGTVRTSELNQWVEVYRSLPGSEEVPLRLRPAGGLSISAEPAVASCDCSVLVVHSEKPL